MNNQFVDITTERACIAAAIVRAEALEKLAFLDSSVFYDGANQKIHGAMVDLYKAGEAVDTLTLRSRLVERGEYQQVGGDKVMAELLAEYPSMNIPYAVRKLSEMAHRRRLVELSTRIKDLSKSPGVENDAIINEIEETIREIDTIRHEEYIHIRKMFEADDIAALYNAQGMYIPTGFSAIDSRLIGLFKSELIILAARPSLGKTALGINIARKVSETKDVLFISLEMSVNQIGLRLISAETRIDSRRIRLGKISLREKEDITRAAARLRELRFTVVEFCSTLDHVIAKARKFAKTANLGLIVVDYLQLIQVPGQSQRYVQVGMASRAMKHLSVELDVPVLCLAQISRESENRAPRLSDLRESGDIEQDADVVMFLHRDNNDKGQLVDVLFAKNRTGLASTSAQLSFQKQFTQFADVEHRHETEYEMAQQMTL
jgi:replicative DNA helicase